MINSIRVEDGYRITEYDNGVTVKELITEDEEIEETPEKEDDLKDMKNKVNFLYLKEKGLI